MFGNALAFKTHDSIPANVAVKAGFGSSSKTKLSISSGAQKRQSRDQLWRIMASLVPALQVENNRLHAMCDDSIGLTLRYPHNGLTLNNTYPLEESHGSSYCDC